MALAQPQPTRQYGPFTGNTAAVGTQVDTDLNTLYTVLQGGVGDTHIASNAAIASSKLATVQVANGGTGVATATAYALLAGGTTGTGALQSLASVGTANQVLTSNGAGALPTWQGTTTGQLRLLKANSGTDTTNAITNVDTVAISGLTANDTLLIYVEMSMVGAAVTGNRLYSTTDSADVALLYQGGASISSGQDYSGQIVIRQNRTVNTKYNYSAIDGVSTTAGGATGGATLNGTQVMATAWTSPWTLALRLGATASTVNWSWSVYQLLGQ